VAAAATRKDKGQPCKGVVWESVVLEVWYYLSYVRRRSEWWSAKIWHRGVLRGWIKD